MSDNIAANILSQADMGPHHFTFLTCWNISHFNLCLNSVDATESLPPRHGNRLAKSAYQPRMVYCLQMTSM